MDCEPLVGESMERMTYWCPDGKGGGEWRANVRGTEIKGEEIDHLAAYEDTGLTPEQMVMWEDHRRDSVSMGRMAEILAAEAEGRLVVLPFQMGKTLLDCSDPERPELLSNFRVALAYDHYGIVFHQPLNIFLENVQKGYIRELSEAAEQALEGGGE